MTPRDPEPNTNEPRRGTASDDPAVRRDDAARHNAESEQTALDNVREGYGGDPHGADDAHSDHGSPRKR